jgi:hypothetical protein
MALRREKIVPLFGRDPVFLFEIIIAVIDPMPYRVTHAKALRSLDLG